MALHLSPSVLKPASAIFVDVPNVELGGLKSPELTRRRLNWRVLGEAILQEDIPGTLLERVGAYAKTYGDAQSIAHWLERISLTFGQAGFSIIPRYGKDVDSWIMNDIWESVVAHEQKSILNERLWYPLQIRHILVSGDGGYLRTYKSLWKTFGDHLELELVVYAWRNGLNDELEAFATKVHCLDEMAGFELALTL
ncbi:MAG: hypothetical protein Q7R54_00340 [bacterium]|nr:hypothetical protein [bacterium]